MLCRAVRVCRVMLSIMLCTHAARSDVGFDSRLIEGQAVVGRRAVRAALIGISGRQLGLVICTRIGGISHSLQLFAQLLLFEHLDAQFSLQIEYEIVFILDLQLQVCDHLLLCLENSLLE